MNESIIATIPATVADVESDAPAISWGAVFAGAFVAFAVSIALLTLGSGLGFSSISPWPNTGVSVSTFGVAAAIWLVLVQWLASASGGYIAGRLRTKWTGVHTDEVYFRDTAHGFVAWAVATAAMAALLSSGVTSAISRTAQAAATVTSGAAQGIVQTAIQPGNNVESLGYFTDYLFRPAPGAPAPATGATTPAPDPRIESTRILTFGLTNGEISPTDHDYLVQLVSARTGLSQADAAKRVDEVVGQVKAAADKAKQAADAARKTAATFSYYLFFSFVVGAFIACVGAAIAGRAREHAEARLRP
jgi:hypothetical protein